MAIPFGRRPQDKLGGRRRTNSLLSASLMDAIDLCLLSCRGQGRNYAQCWVQGLRCLVPGFDGALFSPAWRDALWAKFFMAAPLRQRQSVERYSVVKRA